MIGSRPRKYIKDTGEKVNLIIRRMRCVNCHKIHHELPDILVPYKRYGRESLEAVLSDNIKLSVPVDESTLAQWRRWFLQKADYFYGCLHSIAVRYGSDSEEDISGLPESKLQRIWRYVGDAPGWLGRVVRPIVNLNLWVHTRSAFCP